MPQLRQKMCRVTFFFSFLLLLKGMEKNRKEKMLMDANQRKTFSSVSNTKSGMIDFMPMPPLYESCYQEEEDTDSSFAKLVQKQMKKFWDEKQAEISNAPDVRGQHPLPLACIRRIMKSNEQVKMISADTPMVFAKACEIFIMELTLRACMHSEDSKRKTLQRCDLVKAIRDENFFAFLNDICPERHQEGPLALANDHGGNAPLPATDSTLSFSPVNYQVTNSSVAQESHLHELDPHLCRQINEFFSRNQEMDDLIFPPQLLSQSSNEANHHLSFK